MSLKLKLAYELDCPPEEAAIVTAVCTLKRQLWECRHLAAHGHYDLFSSGVPVLGTGTGSPGLQSSSNNEGEGKISPPAHDATEGEPLSGSAPEETNYHYAMFLDWCIANGFRDVAECSVEDWDAARGAAAVVAYWKAIAL